MKKTDINSGFSLIETLVNVGIFSMLTIAIISFFVWTMTVYSKLQSMDRVTKNINIALSTMVYEIREAQSIYYPTSNSSQISLKTYHNTPDDGELTFVDIYLCGTGVCIKREGEAAKQLTSSQVEVTNLEFIQISTSTAPSVYIDLSIRNKGFIPGRPDNYSTDFHSAATLRSL